MAVDYNPVLGNYVTLSPFRYWCQKVLPLVYDDSLSYYELLGKVVDYLNKTMQDVETLHGDVEGLHSAYAQLQSYVNEYFDNLDVQEEINQKLDAMAEDGSLDDILIPYFDEFKEQLETAVANQNDIIYQQTSQINNIKSRVDELTSLPDGSTSGDAELQDIRVGYSGSVYSSAGNAVRAQSANTNRSLINLLTRVPFSDYTITLGQSLENGAHVNNTKRMRTSAFNSFSNNRYCVHLNSTDYEMSASFYDSTGNAYSGVGYIAGYTWTRDTIYFPEYAKKFALAFKRIDDADVTDTDAQAIKDALEVYGYTDTSLELENQPANSKIVGDKFKNINNKILPNIFTPIDWTYNFYIGESIVDGHNAINETRCRTSAFNTSNYNRYGVILTTSDYQFRPVYYNENGNADTGKGYLYEGTYTNDIIYFPNDVNRFALTFRRTDDLPMSSDDEATIRASIILLGLTDNTLSIRGKAADAKTVGDKFDELSKLPVGITARSNPDYVSQLLSVGRTYKNQGLVYGISTILRKSTSTNQIDCSTFVGMVLRGYTFDETSYHTHNWVSPDHWVAKDNIPWAINPFEYDTKLTANASPTPVNRAAQLCEWLISQGRRIILDEKFANIMPGDILFFARKDITTDDWVEPDRFMHVNHCAFVVSKEAPDLSLYPEWDTEKYPHMHYMIEASGGPGAIGENLVEAYQNDPNYIYHNDIGTLVAVCRPDLGSI